jgi:hypothetical protein
MKKTNLAEVALTDEEDWGLFFLIFILAFFSFNLNNFNFIF